MTERDLGGPPPEAYSRVTDAERFRPLHEAALALLDDLERSFRVRRIDPDGPDRVERRVPHGLARPSVRLVPDARDAAPLLVLFTGFPGLLVRAGHWYEDAFPPCGCDACAETAEAESLRLRRLVDDVVSGRFEERIHLPPIGPAWQASVLGSRSAGHRSAGRSRLKREDAERLVAEAGGQEFRWAPWPRLPGPT